jgi:hypothetical protein
MENSKNDLLDDTPAPIAVGGANVNPSPSASPIAAGGGNVPPSPSASPIAAAPKSPLGRSVGGRFTSDGRADASSPSPDLLRTRQGVD